MLSLGFGHETSKVLQDSLNEVIESKHEQFYFFPSSSSSSKPKARFLYFEQPSQSNSHVVVKNYDLADSAYANCTVEAIDPLFPEAKFRWDRFQVNRLKTTKQETKSFFDGWRCWNEQFRAEHEETFYKMFETFDSLSVFSLMLNGPFDCGVGLACLQEFLLDEYPKSDVFSLLLSNGVPSLNDSLSLAYSGINSRLVVLNDEHYWKEQLFPILHDTNERGSAALRQTNIVVPSEEGAKDTYQHTFQKYFAPLLSTKNSTFIRSSPFKLTNNDDDAQLINDAVSWYENQLAIIEDVVR